MDFKELGLTLNETKVYEVMLRLGKTTAGHICKESQVPYGRIYTVLSSLEEKGLIKTIPEETKKYMPSDPEKLHEIIDAKIKSLMEADNKVKELKKIYEEYEIEPVLIAKGKNNFYKIDKETKHTEKYDYTIKHVFDTNPMWMRDTRERIKKGIDVKQIGEFNRNNRESIKEWKIITKEIKPIDNEGVIISIKDDEEVMIGLIKSNTTMLIRDKAFTKVMRQLFVKYYTYTDYEKE